MGNVDHLIERCPRLKSFTLRLEYYPGEHNATVDTTVDINQPMDLSSVLARPDITRVNARMPINDDAILIYLMNKFPNLKLLAVDDTYFRVGVLPRTIPSLQMLSKFLSSMVQISSHHFSMTLQDTMVPDIVKNLIKRIHTINLNFLLGATTLYYSPPPRFAHIVMETPDRMLAFEDANNHPHQQLQISYDYDLGNLDLFRQAGHLIENLKISISTNCFHYGLQSYTFYMKISNGCELLELIFKYCTQIKQLYLSFLPEYEKRGVQLKISKDVSATITNTSLTDLFIKSVGLHMNFLPTLLRMLPQLKNLQLISTRQGPFFVVPFSIDMVHTSFEQLQLIYNNMSLLEHDFILDFNVNGITSKYMLSSNNNFQPVSGTEEDCNNNSSWRSLNNELTIITVKCFSIVKFKLEICSHKLEVDFTPN